MGKAPAYQWYPKDILSSERVAFLSLSEEGAYRRAMDYCWLQGSIPADPIKLSVLIGKKCTPKIAGAIIHLFTSHPTQKDRLIHDKQEEQRETQRLFREQQVQKGKKGGEASVKQRLSRSLPAANPELDQRLSNGQAYAGQPLHSASAIASSSSENTVVERNAWFEMFRRAAGPHITDNELVLEIGRFKNKYGNKTHPNQAGALVNTWVANIGRIEAERAEATANPLKPMQY